MLEGEQPLTGAVVVNLSPAVSDELSIGDWKGVAIAEDPPRLLSRTSSALEAGDLLIKINGKDVVLGRGSGRRAVAQPADNWSLTVSRSGQAKTIEVR